MKTITFFLCFLGFIGTSSNIFGQVSFEDFKEFSVNNIDVKPVYNYSEKNLNNVDSIPDFLDKSNKLKITGTIFKSDGVTPAKNIVLHIYHSDDKGDFITKEADGKRFIYHSGWIKTDASGQYTFYTFMPGAAIIPLTMPRTKGPKHIHALIKEESKPEYHIDAFLFDNDPLLSPRCRKKLEKKGFNGIVKVDKKDDNMYVVERNIILSNGKGS